MGFYFSPILTVVLGALVVLISYVVARAAIPKVMLSLFERGLYGIDLNKTTPEQRAEFRKMKQAGTFTDEFKKKVVPESLGIVVGGIYLCAAVVLVILVGSPIEKTNAALTSIAVMLLLGFVDDVLDVRWRYKIILSFFGVLPLIMSYDGSVSIMVPIPLREYVGQVTVYLGGFYLLYIALFCVFCTNSINILAGINGVEVGQSLVIAVASAAHNVVQMVRGATDAEIVQHRISLALLLPFIAVSLALWSFNKFPSRVFVGDSFTYFAGMTLAVAGITGVYSKTLTLFFLPQIINFVLSLPQLFKIVPCPRHRVPTWNPKTDKLMNSRNYTLLNAILWVTGDLHERTLTNVVLLFQVLCCAAAFATRYWLAALVFEVVD